MIEDLLVPRTCNGHQTQPFTGLGGHTMDIPHELVQAIAEDSAVLFIGAGLSQGAGLPGWAALLEPLADQIRLPVDRRGDLEQVAQWCESRLGRQALIQHVCQATDTTGIDPTENHQRLLQLSVDTWLTTNYDTLLEKTLDRAGQRHVKVLHSRDLPYTRGDAVTLIKLHGDCGDRDTIVLTQKDYDTSLWGSEGVKDKLSVLLTERTFLYLGYSVSDPDFNQLQSQIASKLGKHHRRAYAVLFEDDEWELETLKGRNIEPLTLEAAGPDEYNARLGEWLDALIAQVSQMPGATSYGRMEGTAPPPIGLSALHQLPPPPADFTGRERELAELEAAFAEGGAAIAGLRGMGGVGKTVLALVLAERLTPHYPDAQLYLNLQGAGPTPLSAAEAMGHVIRSYQPTARLPEDEQELTALYRTVLHGQRALLLMDNAAGRAQVEPLLCPASCALLITSRHHFTLPGLHPVNLDALPREDATELLLRITPRVGDDAIEMARLCGYLPLALRLAGSALAEQEDLPVNEYLARLQEGQGRRALVEASVRLSVDLLDEELQARWRVLGVFPGTFDRAAAAAIWKTDDKATQDTLSELRRYSLVEWDGETQRYRLHDLARDCARAWWGETERAEAEQRHAAHYERVLWTVDGLYKQGGETLLQGLALFDLERGNVETGQRWAAAHAKEQREAARLCSSYPNVGAYYLRLRLHAHEWIRWLEVAADAAHEMGARGMEGSHLGNLGSAYRALGDVQKAIEYHERALAISQEIGDRRMEGNALGNLGSAYRALGAADKAIEYYECVLAISQEIGDRRMEGNALGNLGNAYGDQGEIRKAIEHHERALAVSQEIGDRRGEGADLGHLGYSYYRLEEMEKAADYYQQALAIAREIGSRSWESEWSWFLGLLYQETDPTRAVELMSVRVAYEREIGHPEAEAHAEQVERLRSSTGEGDGT